MTLPNATRLSQTHPPRIEDPDIEAVARLLWEGHAETMKDAADRLGMDYRAVKQRLHTHRARVRRWAGRKVTTLYCFVCHFAPDTTIETAMGN